MSDKTRFEELNLGDDDARPQEKEGVATVGFENVLEAIGPSIRYQVLQSALSISFLYPYGFALFNFVFLGYEPPHVCANTNETDLLAQYGFLNDTTAKVIYETCQIRITSNRTGHPEDVASTGCVNGHSYHGGPLVSMKTEWDLVCEKEGVAESVLMAMNVGMAIGSIFVSPMPDKFGRKRVIIACNVIGCVLEIAMAFSSSIYMVIALRLLSGIMITTLCVAPYTLGAEGLVTRHRPVYACASIVSWSCFLLILGSISYALRYHSWRTLQLATAVISILPILWLYFVNESVFWLLAKGRHTSALEIIKRACKVNKANFHVAEQAYNECVLRVQRLEDNKDKKVDKSTVEKYGFLDIFRHRRLLVTTLVLWLTYFTCNVVYTGLLLTSATFNVNRFFMFMILVAAEAPSTILFFVILRYIGRCTLMIIFLSMTAVCLLVSTCLIRFGSPTSDHVSNASAAFFILGKVGISVSYTCLYCFTGDHYPTTVRNIGMGMSLFVARVGGMISPFLYPLFRIANWMPGTILTSLCFITVGFYFLVPETKGRELPTTIEDVEAMPRRIESIKQRRQRNQIKI